MTPPPWHQNTSNIDALIFLTLCSKEYLGRDFTYIYIDNLHPEYRECLNMLALKQENH